MQTVTLAFLLNHAASITLSSWSVHPLLCCLVCGHLGGSPFVVLLHLPCTSTLSWVKGKVFPSPAQWHVLTVQQSSKAWPRSSWRNEKIFLCVMTRWAYLLDGNIWARWRDKDLKELRCWQKWSQLFIWGKKIKNKVTNKFLEFLYLKTPLPLYPYHSAPWVQKVHRGKRQRGGPNSPSQSNELRAFSCFGWREELGTHHWQEQGIR